MYQPSRQVYYRRTGLKLLNKNELKRLFEFASKETHFLFKGAFYDQVDGVAMGSPLAPVLANLLHLK